MLCSRKFQRAVCGVNADGLSFAEFAFEDVDTERIENFSLNGAPQRSRAVNGIVTFACEQCLCGVGQLDRDLLLFETFRQTTKRNLDDLLQLIFTEPVENDDLVDAVQKLRTKERPRPSHPHQYAR